jgi:hypothetical protein
MNTPNFHTNAKSPSRLIKLCAVVMLSAVGAATLMAENPVYVTARPTPSGGGANPDGTYNDNGLGDDTGAKSTAADAPPRSGSRYFSTGFASSSSPDFGITIAPVLGTAGGVYQVFHTYSSAAENLSADVVLGVTNTAGCTLSFTSADKFQAAFGNSSWQSLGYLTNDAGSTTPTITFYYLSGTVNAGTDQRLEVDCFRFNLLTPCLTVAVPSVVGPLGASVPTVTVTGVATNATSVAAYQDSGSGMVRIGQIAVTNPVATVLVPATGLVKGARVSATQTVLGTESCVQTAGKMVGGGANPRMRVAFSIRETPDSGPVGAAGTRTGDIHFLGASTLLGGAPGDGLVLYPSNTWQTVTLQRGPDYLNPTNSSIKWNSVSGNPAGTLNDIVTPWGILEAIAIAIDDLTDTGPYDLYIDNLQNGSTVFQTFEGAVAGTTGYGFQPPLFSGSTSAYLLNAPDQAVVSNGAADTGTKSLRVQFQWNGTNDTQWLRLTTFTLGDPMVDLADPISIRVLLLPPGSTPIPPTPPTLSVAKTAGNVVLNWPGAHNLQTATTVSGPYTNVTSVIVGPYTNTFVEPLRFFRLVN